MDQAACLGPGNSAVHHPHRIHRRFRVAAWLCGLDSNQNGPPRASRYHSVGSADVSPRHPRPLLLSGKYLTDTFYEEPKSRPALTKQLEGSNDPKDAMTAGAVARATMDGFCKDNLLITFDLQTRLLLNNMRGPSPPNHGLLDWLTALLVSVIWPFFRISMDRQVKVHGSSPNLLSS